MTQSHLFRDAESRLMTERSLHKSNHSGLIKANPQFHYREAGRDRGSMVMVSVLLVRTIGGWKHWIKLRRTRCTLGSAFPTALRKNKSISISYKGDVWASRYANLTEAVWLFQYFYPQLLQRVMTIRHRKIMTGQPARPYAFDSGSPSNQLWVQCLCALFLDR